MRFTIATITALLAASVAAAPAPAPAASPNPSAILEREAAALEARDCKWNCAIGENWGESGLTRYRVRFSTTKPNVDMCGTMNAGMASGQSNCGGIQNNYACYFNHAVNSWVVEVNEVVGPAGWNAIQCQVQRAISWGCDHLGCGTG